MTSSPTLAMPTRSRPTDRCLVALALAALLAGSARAHEDGTEALPERPGWQIGGAAAVVLPHANARWPTAAWPGVLVTGSAPRDQRHGLRLEHAALGVAARLDERFGVQLAAGWHDRERAQIEAATLRARQPLGDNHLELRLGRDAVRLGGAVDGAGHFDRFSLAPLAKTAVLDEQWIDDGLTLAWRRTDANGLRAIEAGLWRGRGFPGGPHGPLVPLLRVHAGWDDVDAHLAAAHLQPTGRGAPARSAGSTGHVHGTLDCTASLQQRVCFDGTVDVYSASLQWEPDASDWTVAFAGLVRRERGALYSASGDAALKSRVVGAWADLAWRPAAPWTLALRLERLVPSNRLEGVGTALLAREAGLEHGGTVDRATVAVLHEPLDGLQLALEGGRERYAGGRVSHLALRASWRNPRWLGGTW